MARVLVLLLVVVVSGVFANPLDDAYREGANLGRTNQGKAMESIKNYKPAETFKHYTENPSQTKYYHGVTSNSGRDLIEAGETEYKYHEDDSKNSGAQAALKAFRKNPSTPYKVDPNNQNDPIISRVSNAIKNYKEGSDCKESATCHIEYVKKKCNEQTRDIKRICEKVPHVTIVDEPYPGCRRHTSPGNVEDCLAGEVRVPHYSGDGYGKITVPRNRGSRVAFDHSRHGYYYVTIVNEATGKNIVPPRTRVNNGRYIELPPSKDKDQIFSFIAHRADGCSCQYPGSLNVYFNYIRKIPKVEWKEGSCRDI